MTPPLPQSEKLRGSIQNTLHFWALHHEIHVHQGLILRCPQSQLEQRIAEALDQASRIWPGLRWSEPELQEEKAAEDDRRGDPSANSSGIAGLSVQMEIRMSETEPPVLCELFFEPFQSDWKVYLTLTGCSVTVLNRAWRAPYLQRLHCEDLEAQARQTEVQSAQKIKRELKLFGASALLCIALYFAYYALELWVLSIPMFLTIVLLGYSVSSLFVNRLKTIQKTDRLCRQTEGARRYLSVLRNQKQEVCDQYTELLENPGALEQYEKQIGALKTVLVRCLSQTQRQMSAGTAPAGA